MKIEIIDAENFARTLLMTTFAICFAKEYELIVCGIFKLMSKGYMTLKLIKEYEEDSH